MVNPDQAAQFYQLGLTSLAFMAGLAMVAAMYCACTCVALIAAVSQGDGGGSPFTAKFLII